MVASGDWVWYPKGVCYRGILDDLSAADLRQLATGVVVDANGTPVSNSYTLSVESYAAVIVGQNQDANMCALLKAMMNYGDAAYELFKP